MGGGVQKTSKSCHRSLWMPPLYAVVTRDNLGFSRHNDRRPCLTRILVSCILNSPLEFDAVQSKNIVQKTNYLSIKGTQNDLCWLNGRMVQFT